MRTSLCAAAALCLIGVLLPVAAAQTGEDVVVGGRIVFKIRAKGHAQSAQERAVLITRRITNALSAGRVEERDIVLRVDRGTPAIYARGILIVTVSAEDARLNATTVEGLAQVWLHNLKEALPRAVPVPAAPP
jgi:hypothetical protein